MDKFDIYVRNSEMIMNRLRTFIRSKQYTIDLDKEISNNENMFDDGRIASAVEERAIKDIITEFVNTDIVAKSLRIKGDGAPGRFWYDYLIWSDEFDVYIPINIKISSFGNAADNLNCLNAFKLLIAGSKNATKATNSKTYLEEIERIHAEEVLDTPRDFYFLVISKNDVTESYFTSLLTIKEFTPNGSNLVQCNWNKNKQLGRTTLLPITEADIAEDTENGNIQRVYRSYDESLDNLIKAYEDSFILYETRASNYNKAIGLCRETARSNLNVRHDDNDREM